MQESRRAGKHIQAEYERIGLTQTALAERMGTTQPNVSAWVNGSREPNREHLVAMSRLFGCSVDYLMGLTEKRGELRAERRSADDEVVERLRLIRQLASGVALATIRDKLVAGEDAATSHARTSGRASGAPPPDVADVAEQAARAASPRRKRKGG
jgi:transcriptional regulator with XRE-family HTH domain